ncbi:hypothetical protein [Gorillibacterium sp. sgz500922]|uniref:hypothetical protein n=1 Tax=Gorillibacterium sp. sgz500922 TaxID=3446694 RepID=UPI003F664409
MKNRVQSKKGITLVEALATLVIATLIGGTILLMINQTHSGTAQLTARESAARSSRTILNHMVNSIRKEPAGASQDVPAGKPLILTYGAAADGHSLTYSYDAATKQLSYTEVNAGTTRNQMLSDKVNSISVTIQGSKITINLSVQVKGSKVYDATTVAYLPDL